MALRSSILRQIWTTSCLNHHFIVKCTTLSQYAECTSRKVVLARLPARSFTVSSSSTSPSAGDHDESQSSRHGGILVHPESIANEILPGNVIMKKTRNGALKKRYTELVYGYFWMLKDLKKTNEKPLQTTIIPEKQAKVFPLLENVKTLSGDNVSLPDVLLRRNKSNDPHAQSTLLAVSFRDFGFKHLPSWTEPFIKEFEGNNRVETYKLIVSEGWFTKYILRLAVQASVKANTDPHDYDRTLLHFSNDSIAFRDPLRMHNLLPGYVFLLDGLGRVRFAGSGQASPEEVDKLIQSTHKLLTSLQDVNDFVGKSTKKRR